MTQLEAQLKSFAGKVLANENLSLNLFPSHRMFLKKLRDENLSLKNPCLISKKGKKVLRGEREFTLKDSVEVRDFLEYLEERKVMKEKVKD